MNLINCRGWFSIRSLLCFILGSVAGGASALVGWFAAYVVGNLLFDCFVDPNKSNGLGEGLLVVLSIYICAFVFGVAGFAFSIGWLTGRRARKPEALLSTPR
jgi:hypothetical protein